jgi:hypothetical protein
MDKIDTVVTGFALACFACAVLSVKFSLNLIRL